MKHNPYRIHVNAPEEIPGELAAFGLKPSEAVFDGALLIRAENVPREAAEQLSQRTAGSGAAVYIHSPSEDAKEVDVLFSATRPRMRELLMESQERGLPSVAEEIGEFLSREEALRRRTELVCGPYTLPLNRTLVMGILNVTPDSFSDGGRYNDVERAVAHARELAAAGADIIDIGGESTRPGHEPVEAAEELDRVLPVVRALAREVSVPLSIDTYKAEVAERAIREGAHIINDVWGAKRDPRMAEVAARLDVPIILMHNREAVDYDDFFPDFVRDLRESVRIAREAGVRDEQIILDPGIGFAKTLEQNLEAMRRLDDLVSLGYPVLLGTSRKSMIGRVLDLPVHDRLEGTAATVALGVAKGCHIVRVHDVKEMKRVVRMMDAMLKGRTDLG